jgi:hypothetical protein
MEFSFHHILTLTSEPICDSHHIILGNNQHFVGIVRQTVYMCRGCLYGSFN